jgi:hypothetical protein
MTKEKEESLSSITIIRDPRIEPFFIGKDTHCYTIYETITPDTRYTENNVAGKEYTKALAHFSTFGNCLKSIARYKVNTKKSYESIQEYLEVYRELDKNISELINIGI